MIIPIKKTKKKQRRAIVDRRLSRSVRTLTRTFVREQLEALPAVALKAADGVSAEVFAASVVKLALVDICGGTGEDILTALQPEPPAQIDYLNLL